MKEIKLKDNVSVLVDDSDYEWLIKYKWYISKGRHTNYAVASINRKIVMMHRLINNTPEGLFTDHINMNGLDNRRENLRTATRSENGRNRKRSNDRRLLKRQGKKQWNFLNLNNI